MLIGSHVNFGADQLLGCAKQAVEYGANTFMFYTGAPQNTVRKEIDEEKTKDAQVFMKENDIFIENVVCHAPYIINLANKKDPEKWNFSITFLKREIARCEKMGVEKIVVHPGSAVGISKEEGIQNIIEAFNCITFEEQRCKILLETMAGKGNECASTLEEVKEILDGVFMPQKFGVCLDTCHLHDAGYDMKHFADFLLVFNQVIGLSKIGCVHINDSKNECGSHKDRHENIGYGHIGFEAFLSICYSEKLKEVPKILETPYVGNSLEDKLRIYPPYRFEIEMLKKKTFDESLYEHIRAFYKKD